MEDKHLPLPEGVERVYKCSRTEGDLRAYPGRHFLFASASPEWSNAGAACDESACTSDMDPVYHVPAPAKDADRPKTKHEALYDAARRYVKSSRFEPDSTIQQDLAEAVRQLTPVRDDPVHDTHARPKIEHQAPSSPEIEQEQGEVFNPNPQPATVEISPEKPTRVVILPPLEIADHAEALGWTEGSEVYDCGCKSYRVYPSGMSLIDGKVRPTNSNAEMCEKLGHTLLPNRRVPVEGEPIAAKAGRCAWCGYTIHDMGVRTGGRWYHNECAPSPRPAKSAGEVADSELIAEAWTLIAEVGSLGGGWASQGSLWQMAAKVWRAKFTNRSAAIERERGR